jgi:secondary thiamine-phosphate synthase enzyme
MQIIEIGTNDRVQLIDITNKVQKCVEENSIKNGICVVFIPHTTAAVTINENADPDVTTDMVKELNKIIPFSDNYRHFEGNSAAHIKSSIIGASETIIIKDGRLQLGTWQGIYFCEFDGPRRRKAWIKMLAFK